MFKKVDMRWLKRIDNEFYLVAPRGIVYQCNEVTARIFDLCNGENDLDQIVDSLVKIYKVERETLRVDVKECLELLVKTNYIFYENE